MSRIIVKFKLYDDEKQLPLAAAQSVNLDLNTLAKKCLLMQCRRWLDQARAEKEKQDGNREVQSQTTSGEVPTGSDTNSSVSSQSQDIPVTSP